jgi:hypothetical protein
MKYKIKTLLQMSICNNNNIKIKSQRFYLFIYRKMGKMWNERSKL